MYTYLEPVVNSDKEYQFPIAKFSLIDFALVASRFNFDKEMVISNNLFLSMSTMRIPYVS